MAPKALTAPWAQLVAASACVFAVSVSAFGLVGLGVGLRRGLLGLVLLGPVDVALELGAGLLLGREIRAHVVTLPHGRLSVSRGWALGSRNASSAWWSVGVAR
jgi:hypothetical protein